jgi:predicted nucleic acid-binding protein
MTVVIDASVAFAGTLGIGPQSLWAREILSNEDVVAPELMTVEVVNIMRKTVRLGKLTEPQASGFISDLPFLVDAFLPHAPLLQRVWELRNNLTSYDATYVALAETLGAPLATLDKRLSQATGPTCPFLSPPEK